MNKFAKKLSQTLFLIIVIAINLASFGLPVYAQQDLCTILGISCPGGTIPLDQSGQVTQDGTIPIPTPANGNNNNGNNGGTTSALTVPNTLGFTNLADIVNQLSVYIIPFAVIGFIGCVIYSGYIRLFSAGDVNGEKKSVVVAKSAAIGFAIIFFANLFLLLLSNILKLTAV